MQPGLARVWIIVFIVVLIAGGLLILLTKTGKVGPRNSNKSVEEISQQASGEDSKLSASQKQFQNQWKKGCKGTGPIQLKALPMNPTDFGLFIPLGLLAGAHVTPIDHLYFSPADRNSERDAYPVYAMGDGYLIEIQRRSMNVDTGAAKKEEFRLTFQHSCTFYTYFDLVTSLTPDVLAAFPELSSRDSASGHLAVKAGQQIGKIGGQTLDSAVYNLEVALSGYIHPELYDGEAWKIHTDEFTKYFPANLQAIINSRNVRVAEPRDGKIDYDIDGKLIGNWFKAGTKGYVDETMPDRSYYWEGHLALVPDVYDPTLVRISIGNWQNKAEQFAVKGNVPDPASVGVGELVKYELVQGSYLDATGQNWDNFTYTPSVKGKAMSQVEGVALFQLQEDRQLKAEFFPGKTAAQVTVFTDQAWNYFR